MPLVLDFQSCQEVGPELIEASFDPEGRPHPAERVLRLLERMARVARPNSGAPRILIVLARLAQADWVEGRLQVTLRDFGVATEFDVRIDDGRLATRWRSFSVAVPLGEFTEWLKKKPALVRPLAPFGEPIGSELRLRAPERDLGSAPSSGPSQTLDELGKSAPGSRRHGRPDVHRRDTLRMQEVKVPDEARRTHPELAAPGTDKVAAAEAAPKVKSSEDDWDWD